MIRGRDASRTVILGAWLLLFATIAHAGGCRTAPRIDGPPPRVEFRLAEFQSAEGFEPAVSRHGETLFVSTETIIDLEDISTSLLHRQGDDDFLLLNVKAGSRMRLDAATLAHLERPVVVMVDGEVVYAPMLRTSISRQVPIRVGVNGITYEEAKRVLDAVADQREFGPWSARSGDSSSTRAGRFRADRAAKAEKENAARAAPTAPAPTSPAPAITPPDSAAVTVPASPPPQAPDRGK